MGLGAYGRSVPSRSVLQLVRKRGFDALLTVEVAESRGREGAAGALRDPGTERSGFQGFQGLKALQINRLVKCEVRDLNLR